MQQCCRPPLVLAIIRHRICCPNVVCEGSQSVSIQCAKRVNGKFGHMSVNFRRNLHGLHHVVDYSTHAAGFLVA